MATARKPASKATARVAEPAVKEKPACSDDACDRTAYSKGICARHYTAERRKDPAVMEKAREASRRYAAKKKEATAPESA